MAIISIVAFIKRIPDNLAEITFGLYCFILGPYAFSNFLSFFNSLNRLCNFDYGSHVWFYELLTVRNKGRFTSIGNIAKMALFGIVRTLIVNLFIWKLKFLTMILSILGVIVFSALTAYDTQNIKNTLMNEDGKILIKERNTGCPQSLSGFRESLLGPYQIIREKEKMTKYISRKEIVCSKLAFLALLLSLSFNIIVCSLLK